MFSRIFSFEIKYRLRRPAVYLYFLTAFVFTFLSFAHGAMPLADKQMINSPASLAFFVAMMSMAMMLVSSYIMGIPLYRDIEYNTKEYYLSYPVTKAGYFWGRYLSSFLFIMLINTAVLLGAWLGSKAGPALGWESAARYGPDHWMNYIHPFLIVALPNLFFTASLFFGLVAITRNVKVIYSSGILLFLGYLISKLFLNSSTNAVVINLADPFAVDAVKYQVDGRSAAELNTQLLSVHGLFLWNRVLWTGVGLLAVLLTYWRFSFEKFFSGKRDRQAGEEVARERHGVPALHISFSKSYRRRTLYTLSKIEIVNLVRDNYLWIILAAGSIFLGIVFSHGPGNYGIRDFPRTSMLLFMFDNNFLIFIFCILIFYTGETIHRERSTGFAFINDALPPSDWTLNLAKFISILFLALFLAILPMLIGIVIQLAEGYTVLNLPLYFQVLFFVVLPKLVEMVMLAFFLHILVNNKFVAIGIGIAYAVLCVLAFDSGWMNYNLFLYSYTPFYGISDLNGVGHMMKPLDWFNGYWLLFGALLLLTGYLLFIRGILSSFRERLQLAKERFTGRSRMTAYLLVPAFLATAGYNYYNVDFLNSYYTKKEKELRSVAIEKRLKRYEDLPVPKVTDIKLEAAIFPRQEKATYKAFVTVMNKGAEPIDSLLLDGDNLTDYSLRIGGVVLPYTNPLSFPRGAFNFFQPAPDSSSYRVYRLQRALLPGDSTVIEVHSIKDYRGFQNDLYGTDLLHNGTMVGIGLPDLGYDDDEELTDEIKRREYGLPEKEKELTPEKDVAGRNYILFGKTVDLEHFDITVSTSADQTVLAPGDLKRQWTANGRNYFEYTSGEPGSYTGLALLSARYAVKSDSVRLDDHRQVTIDIYYDPANGANLSRFMSAYKDGLKYYSSIYGPFPFRHVRLVEGAVYIPNTVSLAATDIYSERFAWSARFTNPDQPDYCYYVTALQLAKQWWGKQVAPNHTRGSAVIMEGLSKYSALMLEAKKQGRENMSTLLRIELEGYLWGRGRHVDEQDPVLYAHRYNEWSNKAGIVLYGLQHLMGEDSLNKALRAFKDSFAYRTQPPFAGSKDLYACLQRYVPDSLQYYLRDTWEKITFYDNQVLEAKAMPLGNNQYKVHMRVSTGKTYEDSVGHARPAAMNDYIDIGIFGADTKDKAGRTRVHPLYLKRYKFTAGEHTIDVTVTGKPAKAGIDPYLTLIDRKSWDNRKGL